jgi:UDP-GlcNAc3NAcA epimerase
MSKHILTVIGARPQFIKAAPLSKAIKNDPDFRETIIHTGQHFDTNMSAVFFEEMGIPKPDYQLAVHSMSHGAMTGKMLEEIEKIILKENPDILLVYGDTNSTLAGALAAKKCHVQIAHVEAGLRSFNIKMPEEVNRILTDRISDYLICPSDAAIINLKKEGFEHFDCKIVRTGDIMCDAMHFFTQFAPDKESIFKLAKSESFALTTIHRAENTDNPKRLESIIRALNEINKELTVVLPIHPRTRKILEQRTYTKPEFKIIEPVGYLEMLGLLHHSKIVFTDSGGLQKEAFMKAKFCITLRDETEWTELLDSGVNFLAGADEKKIISLYNELKNKVFSNKEKLYGTGNAANEILNALR